jgi:hypothetical protein
VTGQPPGRADTGHPFGFLRSLVHHDGHVRVSVNSAALIPQLDAYRAFLAALGLGEDLTAAWLPAEQAVTAYLAGQGCRDCRIVLSCGCDPVMEALAGRCRHGGARRARQAAKAAGLNLSVLGQGGA